MKKLAVGTEVYFVSYYWSVVVKATIKYKRTASSGKKVFGLQTSDCPEGMVTEVYEEDFGVYFTETMADGEKLIAVANKPRNQRGAEHEVYVERMRRFDIQHIEDGKLA